MPAWETEAVAETAVHVAVVLVLAVVVLICIVESLDTWIFASESVIGENGIDSSSSEKILELTEDELLLSGSISDSPTCTSIDWRRLIS